LKAITTSTRRALRPSGLWKALTPMEIASSPVSDEPPLVKDRSNVNTTTAPVNVETVPTPTVPGSLVGSYTGSAPSNSRTNPVMITVPIATENR
jgi:hypothetical protein